MADDFPTNMSESRLQFKWWLVLIPPVGIVFLWIGAARLWRKLAGTVGLAILSIFYAILTTLLLIRFTGLEVEWRGGYLPALTYHKTRANFEALERSRTSGSPVGFTNAAAKAGSRSEPYWTSFRGPLNDGHYQERPILTNWPASGLKLLWKQPIGGGYGSFAIANGRAFTIEQRRDNEAAVAYDLETGRELWSQSWAAHFDESMGGDGPRSTPTYSDGRVFALGALGDLSCLDEASGSVIWSHNILKDNNAPVPTYGIAVSPLLFEDKLVVLTGAGNGRSVQCYEKSNGRSLWSAADDRIGYATPELVTLDGEPQILVSLEKRTLGVRPADGKPIWEYPWQVLNHQMPIAQPVVLSSNRFLLAAGYFTGCAAVQVTHSNSSWNAETIWRNKNMKNKFSSSVFWQGHIYGLDEDILTCLDAATGDRRWKGGRYGYGQLLLASGHLILLSGDGDLALVAAQPQEFHELARFHAINGKTWNYPALAGGKLLVRNGAEMACFDISP